jgi:hypothetical protein
VTGERARRRESVSALSPRLNGAVAFEPSAADTTKEMAERRFTSWIEWYRFARQTLEYSHEEAVAYANLREVEEQNRKRLCAARAV